MNPQMQKYEYVFPEKVYHCPCFRFGVEECFNHGQRSFASIIRYLENFDYKNNFLCKRFFSTAVGENMNIDCLRDTFEDSFGWCQKKLDVRRLKIIRLFL